MVSRERLLLIVAADWREFAGFRRRRSVRIGLRWAFRTDLASGPALLAANGPGRDNARLAVEAAVGQYEISGVVSTGFAGALDPALSVGDLFNATRVVQPRSRVEYPGGLTQVDGVGPHQEVPSQGTLVTIDAVAQSAADKASLRLIGADVVDMEAAEVARQARLRGLPFYCVRVISDGAETDFAIDFNRARRADGTFSGWQLAKQAGWSVSRWRDLLKLKRDSELAAKNLASHLIGCQFLPSPK